nr:carboxypeptidase-like regulatory domain-containing protein [Chitinophagaceae bacterium]
MLKKLVLKIHFFKICLLCIFAFVLQGTSYSQQGSTPLTGTITSVADGSPLSGVSVQVKGSTVGTTSSDNGTFSLSVPEGATLVFSYLDSKKEIPVNGQSSLSVSLDAGSRKGLDEVVVIGYGTQKKGDLTSAISTISAKKLEGMPLQSTESLLQGQASGLTVTSDGGEPGNNGKIRIRGVGTFGNNNPLYVVDGIPVN